METPAKIDNSLSKSLKYYRRVKNFSQESLAEVSGISVRTIQRLETGESIGSAYTLSKLASTLGIDVSDLTNEPSIASFDHSNSSDKLNMLNLSALSVILIPLSNIILPVLLLLKNQDNADINQGGRKILNFQILWTLTTIFLMTIVPLFLMLFKPFQASGIPLSIPVYYICVVFNVFFTLRFSMNIKSQRSFLNHIPTIL